MPHQTHGRRDFLRLAGIAAGALAARTVLSASGVQTQTPAPPRPAPPKPAGPKGSEFVFARLRYDSGDWDYNPKVAANVLNSVVDTRRSRSTGEEVVIAADVRRAARRSRSCS